jgi:periplasmic protein TonB
MHAERATPVEATISARTRWIGLVVSLLVHLLAATALFVEMRLRQAPPEPEVQPIEVVFLPPPAPPPPQEPPPPPPRPQPQMATPPVPKPDPLQLNEAPIAREANAPRRPPEQGRQGEQARQQAAVPRQPTPPAPALGPGLGPPPTPRADESHSTPLMVGRANKPLRPDDPATQTIKDFLLMQVMPFWPNNPKLPEFEDLVIGGGIMLQADGFLSPPFGKNDPFDPQRMIRGYETLGRPEFARERSLVINFLHALRAAQPLRLPRTADARYPMVVPFVFRLGDL